MTDQQKRIYLAIRAFIETNGYGPTIREICNAVGLSSSSTVKSHVDTLRRKGYVTFEKSLPRTIRLTDKPLEDGGAAA